VKSCLTEERLAALAESEPEAEERQHLEICAECAALLAEMKAGEALFASLKSGDGLVFGDYRDCLEIAGGAMSRVYRGRARDGSLVALKVCRRQDLLPLFRNEARLLRLCRDQAVPGVIPLIAVELEHLPAYIVTPFFSRGTLEQSPPQGSAALLALARHLALTLEHLARLGIVHGDLKASNVLIGEDGCPWLADLGGSRRVRPATVDGQAPPSLLGTSLSLVSLSPEQARGEEPRPACDVFALGILLYRLASGVHPFAAASDWELAAKVLRDRPVPLRRRVAAELRRDFAPLVMACLEKDPARRPAAAELRRRLELMQLRSPPRWSLLAAFALPPLAALLWWILSRPELPAMPPASDEELVIRGFNESAGLAAALEAFRRSEDERRNGGYDEELKARRDLELELKKIDPEFRRLHDDMDAVREHYKQDRSDLQRKKACFDGIDMIRRELRRRAPRWPALKEMMARWEALESRREERTAEVLESFSPDAAREYREALRKVRISREALKAESLAQ
jgi:serine/threonine protein kinase